MRAARLIRLASLRWLPLLAGAWLLAACQPSIARPPAQAAVSADDQALLLRVERAMRRHHITRLPAEHLSFVLGPPSPPGRFRSVDVRENHRPGGPGDPDTAPRLFTVRCDQKTGALSTDAGSLDGEFHPLRD